MVNYKVELVLGVTHAVGTVGARGAVGRHAAAVRVAADDAEQVGVLGCGDGVFDDAFGGGTHAVAQVRVGGWREGRCGCFPGCSDGWARL